MNILNFFQFQPLGVRPPQLRADPRRRDPPVRDADPRRFRCHATHERQRPAFSALHVHGPVHGRHGAGADAVGVHAQVGQGDEGEWPGDNGDGAHRE